MHTLSFFIPFLLQHYCYKTVPLDSLKIKGVNVLVLASVSTKCVWRTGVLIEAGDLCDGIMSMLVLGSGQLLSM